MISAIDPCSLLIPAAILEAIGYLVLWPLIKKKPKIRLPRRFSIADFAALLCYVQFVMAFAFYYREMLEESIGVGVGISVLGIAMILLWSASVSVLNQLELNFVTPRMIFLLVLLPGVIALMIGLPVAFAMSIRTTLDFEMQQYQVVSYVGLAIAVALGIGLRCLTTWLIKDAKSHALVSPPTH